MAPEFFRREMRSELDIYSLGVIIMEILTGQKGYSEIEDVRINSIYKLT
jgi:serine/threonine protein kinase